ncbi:CdaR family protein [Bacillus carboniphilus]|uniref:CdaR family protein n=1 Tax=Bacillus carboniphilus TaxID=86663 RepID=A0ABY9JUC9_9BACI|nr:CdaR family protein [Bacillus carboniphilus]WLR42030.1 CdaR family protein [Bacillus carboniphilus]
MDKFINNLWFLRIVALLLSLMLYMSITIESETGENGSSFFGSSSEDTVTISDVEIEVRYDQENTVYDGIPQTVEVTLSGPKNILTPAKQKKDFKLFVDIQELPALETHRVKIQHEGISDKLQVKIEPEYVDVFIDEKVEKSFTVSAETFNEKELGQGYSATDLTIEPNEVEITGAKTLIDSIGRVKAIVNLATINNSRSFEQVSEVKVYDKEGRNITELIVEPSTVTVKGTINIPSKTVPVTLKKEGSLPEGLSITKSTVKPNEIKIYGPQDKLDEIESVEALLDLSSIEDDGRKTISVTVPEGIERVSSETVEVDVTLEKEETKVIEDVTITTEIKETFDIQFIDPEEDQLDVTITGVSNVVNQMNKDDITLVLDLSDLNEGEHDVEVQVDIKDDIKWTLAQEKVKVKITSKEASEAYQETEVSQR